MKRPDEGWESQVWSQVVISFFVCFWANFSRLVNIFSFENAKNGWFLGGSCIKNNLNSIKFEIVRF
jgi:hypothetical protein